MKKFFILLPILFLIISLLFAGCAAPTTGIAPKTEDQISESTTNQNTTAEESSETAGEAKPSVMAITPKEVFDILSEGKDYFLLDVRTPEEYSEGHIEGATLIPVAELEGRLGELPEDKPIIVYCRSGNRSRTAANILIENGFKEVYDMGGIVDWQAEGYPVVVE